MMTSTAATSASRQPLTPVSTRSSCSNSEKADVVGLASSLCARVMLEDIGDGVARRDDVCRNINRGGGEIVVEK